MKTIHSLIVGLLLTTLPLSAQKKPKKEYEGSIHITPLRLEQEGDSLYIRILYDVSGVNVDSRRSLSLTPRLVAPHRTLLLPEVLLKGRNNYRVYNRRRALMSAPERERNASRAPYAVLKGYRTGEAVVVDYTQALPYESWMDESRLDMQEDWCGCGHLPRAITVSQLLGGVQRPAPAAPAPFLPSLTYVRPAIEAVKRREATAEAFLDFVVNTTDIRPDYMNNPRELKKITDQISELKSHPDVSVGSISVIGYASPEGTLEGNRKLSEGRARTLVNYLLSRFDYPKSIYRVQFGGENWQGLREKLEESDFSFQSAALEIIDRIPSEINYKTRTSRKKSLMDLQGGAPYRLMQKELFPSLRKAICRMDYVVGDFDVETAKQIIGQRPQDLSLNEMYQVANTYESGSQEFVDLFETAARIYPDDPIANLNAASAALVRGDLFGAERYLSKVPASASLPEYDNAQGVLAMLRGDDEQAEEWLQRAAQAGLEAAEGNLIEVVKRRSILTKTMK